MSCLIRARAGICSGGGATGEALDAEALLDVFEAGEDVVAVCTEIDRPVGGAADHALLAEFRDVGLHCASCGRGASLRLQPGAAAAALARLTRPTLRAKRGGDRGGAGFLQGICGIGGTQAGERGCFDAGAGL